MNFNLVPPVLAAVLLLQISPARLSGANPEWFEVDQAELKAKVPTIDKDADAEAIFWQVRVADEADYGIRAVLTHYIRIKIFTERGRDSQSTVDIPFLSGNKIQDIAGRTIKPNGDIVDLKKDAIYERVIVKAGGVKVKAKSFAMPAVEPGAVIEYRWKEIRQNELTNYVRLQFQREIPVRAVKYYIKPFVNPLFPFGMRVMFFQMRATPFVKEKDGFYSTVLTDVPAFKEEPYMPPESKTRAWMLVYYSPEQRGSTPEKFWAAQAKSIHESAKARIKINDEIRRAAESIVGDAAGPEEKVGKIFDWVRKEISNVKNNSSDLTEEEKGQVKQAKTTVDTLRQKAGTPYEIDLLFIALAQASGVDARLANTGDRREPNFDKTFLDSYLLRTYSVAVHVGERWRFYDPGSSYSQQGMLVYDEEGQQALIADPKEAIFATTPVSTPNQSLSIRRAKFNLDEEGTLEGDVSLEYTGHSGTSRRWHYQGMNEAEREEDARTGIKDRFPGAELSKIKVLNVTDINQPIAVTYHVKIPNYAERTGRRMFVRPAFFHANYRPRFTASQRTHSIVFDHAWMEDDIVEIALPVGFTLDHPEGAPPLKIGEVGMYQPKLVHDTTKNVLHYRRTLVFGNKGGIEFPPTSYQGVKQAFDRIQEGDNIAVTLKQEGLKLQ